MLNTYIEGDWRYSSTHIHLGTSGQFHVPATVHTHGESPQYPVNRTNPEQGRATSLAPTESGARTRRSCGQQRCHYTDWATGNRNSL